MTDDGRYFTDRGKRGELHELKEELHHQSKDKKKEAVKKVIQAMTVGRDVSSLFPDVVNCMQTSSLDLKKLVYLYVINYAKDQPELAILAVNTFRKDAMDPNPLIRALAVRTMGCIRLDQITEYLLEPLRRSCKDQDPYVRKTATICIAKLFDINPELVEDQGFIEILKDMLSDPNPMVVANAVASLCEISNSSGRNYLQLNENAISKLLSALNESTEWGQVFILDALAMYKPPSSRNAELILERVMVRLSHANSAVVLSAVKVMMKFMDRITSLEMINVLCKKLTPPLVTLLSSEPEVQYVVMRNINIIVQKRPQILATDVRIFFCKYNDPVYVKMEKIEIMVQLASEKNVDQVLSEFKEYASEVDVDIVRRSVRAIGRCAIKLDRAAEQCINALLELIETRVNYVVQEAIVVIKDIFRKYPRRYEAIISALCENLDSLDEPEAKASMIWILGEYAEKIEDSDQLLESFLETFQDEAAVVQEQLLTASVKVFLKNPQNTQEMVQRVMRICTEDCDNPDLRDRGYIYWRLLTTNPETAKSIVLGQRPTINDDSFACPAKVLDRLVENISTLASVYHKVPESFVTVNRVHAEREDNPDSDIDQENINRVQAEMRAQAGQRYEENSASGSGEEEDEEDSSEDEVGNKTPSGSQTPQGPAPEPLQQPIVVLNEQTAGSYGQRGVRIAARVQRGSGGRIGIQFTIGNFSPQPLGGFAIQFNKNPFGFAPATPLQMADIGPNSTGHTILVIVPNQLNSGTAPTNPPVLQVAVKCSLDIFYFSIPFCLSVVLVDNPAAAAQEFFRDTWQRIGEARQLTSIGQVQQKVPPQAAIQRMQQYSISFVAQRPVNDVDFLYFSCTTTNKLIVLCELAFQQNGPGVKLAVRTEAPPLVPMFQKLVADLFQPQRLEWQQQQPPAG